MASDLALGGFFRIIGFGVHAGAVDGPVLGQMFSQATSSTSLPGYLSTDHDPLFRFHRWKANLRILEITEIKTVPYVPISHPFVERLIGTIRREYLDRVLFWNARNLWRKLHSFKDFYNSHRCHYALNGDPPITTTAKTRSAVIDRRSDRWQIHCQGLYHLPIAA